MDSNQIDTDANPLEKTAAGKEPNRRRSTYTERIEAIDHLPRRNWLLHRLETVQSFISLGILIFGMAAFSSPVPLAWVWLDIGLGVLFLLEFFTRSGFRWNAAAYTRTHVFDLIALVPAIVFLHHGVPAEALWVWIILIARVIRVFDRTLGDGFLLHNFFVLLEGFEQEITDRVVLRTMDRIQADMVAGKFGHSAADAMAKNKKEVLKRVRAEHPRYGVTSELARFVGLEAAVERAEERIYDAMVDVLRSSEVDNVIKTSLNAIFDQLRAETGKREWIKHLGIPGHHERILPHDEMENPTDSTITG